MDFKINKAVGAKSKALLTTDSLSNFEKPKASHGFIKFPKSTGKSDLLKGVALGSSLAVSSGKSLNINSISEAMHSSSSSISKTSNNHDSAVSSNKSKGKESEELRAKLNEDKEEFNVKESLTEEEIQERMQLFGKSREKVIADQKKFVKKSKKNNEMLKNTKASNGMSLPDAKRAYMDLYLKYIKSTSVAVPMVFNSKYGECIGATALDVDPEIIEENMTSEDRERFQKAKAAIAELEQNSELMEAYKYSNTWSLEHQFNRTTMGHGLQIRSWENYAQQHNLNPYSSDNYNFNHHLVWFDRNS